MSTNKTVNNKVLDQIILPHSDNTLFRNKAANSGHSRAAQPNCSETPFVEKTNQYHTCCFGIYTGRFVTSAPWDDKYLGKPKPRRLSKLTVVVVVSSMRMLQLKNYPTFSSLIFGYCYALLLALLVLSQCVEEQADHITLVIVIPQGGLPRRRCRTLEETRQS